MNAKSFRQAFRANISCPSNLQNISITATALKSSDNWADVMRDNGRKTFCSFHFDNGTTYGLHFAAFELFLKDTPFYYCEGVEMETRTRGGFLEVFVYANKTEVAKWEKILSDRKAEELAREAAELDQQQAEYEAAQEAEFLSNKEACELLVNQAITHKELLINISAICDKMNSGVDAEAWADLYRTRDNVYYSWEREHGEACETFNKIVSREFDKEEFLALAQEYLTKHGRTNFNNHPKYLQILTQNKNIKIFLKKLLKNLEVLKSRRIFVLSNNNKQTYIMNLAQFRTAFATAFPQLSSTSIVKKGIRSSFNWDAICNQYKRTKVLFNFHFGTRGCVSILNGNDFADFVTAFTNSTFFHCANLEIETTTYNGEFEVFIYANAGEFDAAETAIQEAAELDQQQAEYEAAQAENEAEEVAPEFIGLEFPTLVHNAEADEFITNLGTYPFLNGKISYKWGSYTYLCNSQGGVFCQGETIAEDVESAQDAYEIAREHFYSWEYAQMQSAQQSDANTPQVADISADITYINTNQAPDLGETTAEQMQDNTPQEDAETSEPFVKLAYPQALTNAQIAGFFEQYEKSTSGHYTVSLGGHFWNIGITAVPNTRKTVSITGLYSSNGVNGSTVIVGRKDNYTLALRYIYECIYKHIQKITQTPNIEPIIPSKGIHAIGNSMQEQADLELILAREIPCTCVGLSGEVLTDARLIWDYNPKLEQITYQAFKETSEGLFHIENVYWVIPQTPIQVLWQMQAELTRQANLIKNPNN